MSEKGKRGNGAEQRARTGRRNAKGQFAKGGQPGPGRGHRRERGGLATRPTPAGRPGRAPIAYGELEDRLSRQEAEAARLQEELALVNARLSRSGREWSAALAALGEFPAARDAVLAALWPAPQEAEHAQAVAGPAAGPSLAGPGGEPAVSAEPVVPLPAEKREGDRPRGVREQMAELGLEHGRGGLQPNRGRRGDGSRDEILPAGSELERGRWGDDPPF